MQNPYSLILVAVIFISSCHKENLQSNTNCTDFLENWDIQISEYNPGIQKQNDIFFPSDQIGYSVGNAGSIMRTINGGTSWEVIQHYYLPEEGINKLAPTKAILESVYFINDSIGFAGDKEKIMALKALRTLCSYRLRIKGYHGPSNIWRVSGKLMICTSQIVKMD